MGRGTSTPFELPDVIRLAWDEEDLIAASKAEEVARRLEELAVYDRVIDGFDVVGYDRQPIESLIWENRSVLTDPNADPDIKERIERAIEKVVIAQFTDSHLESTPEKKMHGHFLSSHAVPHHVPFVREIEYRPHLVASAGADKTVCGKKIPYGEGDGQSVKQFMGEPCEKCQKKIGKDKSLSFLLDMLAYNNEEALPEEWDAARATCAQAIKERIIKAKKEDWFSFKRDIYKVLGSETIRLSAKRLMNMPPEMRFHTLLGAYESAGYSGELEHVRSLYDSIELAYGGDATTYPWPSEKELEEFLRLAQKEGSRGSNKIAERDITLIAAYTAKYLPEAAKRFVSRYRDSRVAYSSLFKDVAFYIDKNGFKNFGKASEDDY